MADILNCWVFDYKKVEKIYGSNEASIEEKIKETCSDLGIDETSVTRDPQYAEEEWHEASPTYINILREIVQGRINQAAVETWSERYDFVLAIICEAYGELQPIGPFENIEDNTLKQLDRYFNSKGVKTRLVQDGKLVEGIPPLNKHLQFDMEYTNFMDPETVKQCVKRLEPLDIMGLDKDVAAGVVTIYSWLKSAANKGYGLYLSL